MSTPPVVLTLAGSDCSAGAGMQADLKAIAAGGGYGVSALTSVVSEIPGHVSEVRLLDPAFIVDQVRVLFRGFPIAAAKTGMLGGREQVQAVCRAWKEFAHARIPLVVDPVMVATSGDRLLTQDAMQTMMEELFPLATLITPNMDEAGLLWGSRVAKTDDMQACAQALNRRFGIAVLVKGGHLQGEAADVLCVEDQITWHTATRTAGVQTHGTGCTYSAAIATHLASGCELAAAVDQAKRYISRAISEHFIWSTAAGGTMHALNHLHLAHA